MTCIIGFISGGVAYMAADSLVTRGYQSYTTENKKMFKRCGITMGVAGSSRLANLLYTMPIPDIGELDPYEYVCTSFADAVQKTGVDMSESNIMLAIQGRLFAMFSNYGVTEYHKYGAIGSGEDFALGAIEAMLNLGLGDAYEPEFILMRAMEAAGKWCNSVGEPYYVIK